VSQIVKTIFVLCALFPPVTFSGSLKLSGFASGELRGFINKPQYDRQFSGFQSSFVIQPEIRFQTSTGLEQFSFVPFARLDSRDDKRSHVDVREAYWEHISDQWVVLVGVNRVFWGVVESNHLVDIINQTDQVEDVAGEEKLGQPMLSLATQREWGDLSLLVMPWFRERSFPSEEGRLRPQIAFDRNPRYESAAKREHVDLAVRYSHYIGDWDIGFYYFKGTGREPRLLLNEDKNRLLIQYDIIDQIGADVQLTQGVWLWKLEVIARLQNDNKFAAAVGGFEYTVYQFVNSAADLGFLIEYMYDDRVEDPTIAPPTIFNNDIFLATRLGLNDAQNSSLLAGVLIDRINRSSMLSIEAKRRLSDHWSVEFESRWFLNIKENSSLAPFKKDSFLLLKLARYF